MAMNCERICIQMPAHIADETSLPQDMPLAQITAKTPKLLVTTVNRDSLETTSISLQGLQSRINLRPCSALPPNSLLTCGVAARVVYLHRGSLIKLHDQAVVISLLTPQVWAGRGREPQQVVVPTEVAGEEQIRAEGGNVIREVPNGDVVVPGAQRSRWSLR